MSNALREMPALASLYLKAVRKKNNKNSSLETPLPALEVTLDNQRINLKHLQRYCGLCGFPQGKDLPPTYLQILSFPLQMHLLTNPKMPYAVMGLVHLENRVDVLAPLVFEDGIVNFRVFIGEQRLTSAGLVFEVIAEAKDSKGECVWRASAGLLHRCKTGIEKPERKDIKPLGTNKRQWSLAGNIGRRYGTLSKDMNPIHLFGVTAKLFGFKRHIAHGLFINAKATANMTGMVPPAPYSIATEFKRPLFIPAKPVLYQGNDQHDLKLELWSQDHKNLHMAVRIHPITA
ncbi:Uncharacterised protein [BD1-7 clade bacterium]|uniref:MaoC-like domain-containing protein n=1 Tax=BD1-7 clade bacterium TaxID=2029982 RepID=A0A5S9NMI0_9GAMM|nr:Uncharacterised protein [BD1-7 clade bacterium]CAA0093135.1 Uncharacterised protein [BD1-7 clade bacterium]